MSKDSFTYLPPKTNDINFVIITMHSQLKFQNLTLLHFFKTKIDILGVLLFS